MNAELTDAYELGYDTFLNKSTITLSAYWWQTSNSIENISRLVPPDDTTRVL